ncbi:MAG: hypothetical protein ACK5UX_16630 [Burkholderiales bacterium]|jgi:hypothetical protein|nr:hypothetical protein [Nitrosomonadaceae bacterium]
MNPINKDNTGSLVLIAGMFFVTAAALFSAADVTAAPAKVEARVVAVDTITVTATRLK